MRVALLGDIALFGRFDSTSNPSIRRVLEPIAEYLHGFDLVVGNLEVPLTTAQNAVGPKSAHLRADPRNASLLRFLGVHAVSLANNHIFDFGQRGLDDTKAALDSSGIEWFGVGGQQAEFRNGKTGISFRGYCSWNTNPQGMRSERNPGGVDPLVIENVLDGLGADRKAGLLPIISVHSGDEHVHHPSYDDIRLARGLAHIGPYVYCGHHPHVIQTVERYNSSTIAYSLGNFCFDDVYTPLSTDPLIRQSEANRQGLILALSVEGATVNEMDVALVVCDDDIKLIAGNDAREASARHALPTDGDWSGYEAARLSAVRAWRVQRKSTRNWKWYWRRFRWRSVRLLLTARFNRLRYIANISQQLDRLPDAHSSLTDS